MSQWLTEQLQNAHDETFRLFQAKLIPNIDPDTIIGVKTPRLKEIAKEFRNHPDAENFLRELPHSTLEENLIHSRLIMNIRKYDKCLAETDRFLPYVDNWAVCDTLNPAALSKAPERLITDIRRWISDDKVYTIRFGIGMCMRYYLDNLFREEYPELVMNVTNEDYYVQMMQAWYFATALAKQYPSVIPYLEQTKLSPWVHNKTIQKAVESYRITPEKKEYLKSLRIRKGK